MVRDYNPDYYDNDDPELDAMNQAHLSAVKPSLKACANGCLAADKCQCIEPAPRPFPGEHLSDRELLLEIHEFIGNIHGLLPMVAPALEGISKSPIGKMLGIR